MLRAINGFLIDGTLINGVANFYRSAKPLTRIDRSALVIGDVWVNPNTGISGFWNGTYWLSSILEQATAIGRDGGYSGGLAVDSSPVTNSVNGVFVERTCIAYNVVVAQDASNYWTFAINSQRPVFDPVTVGNVNTIGQVSMGNITRRVLIYVLSNTFYSTANLTGYTLNFALTGAGGTVFLSSSLSYRQVL